MRHPQRYTPHCAECHRGYCESWYHDNHCPSCPREKCAKCYAEGPVAPPLGAVTPDQPAKGSDRRTDTEAAA